MMGRLENVFRQRGQLLRGAYSSLATAIACGLLVLLLWPQSPRSYRAEATATAQERLDSTGRPDEAIAWLKSDEVLRAAITNLRTNQPHTLGAELGDPLAGDPVELMRQRLQVLPLASPDEMPRLSIGCRASRPRAALAIADELARQLVEHYGTQQRHDLKSRFEEKEQKAKAELSESRLAQERLEIQLEGLRHAQLTSAVAASAAQAAADRPPDAKTPEDGAAKLKQTLDSLKVERDRLLEVYLPAHPQVQSLIAQISHLEDSMRRSAPEGEEGTANPPPEETGSDGAQTILKWQRGQEASAAPPSKQDPARATAGKLEGELAAAIQKAQLDLLAATQRRREAEEKLQSLSVERTEMETAEGLAWSIQPARIVEFGGSSQGRPQLAAALLASLGGSLAAAWLMRMAARDRPLATAADVGLAISVPLLGVFASNDEEAIPPLAPTRGQWGLNLVTRCAEAVVLTFVLTLLAAAALDRGLLAELMLDPLAALGDLLRRLV
jgi:hypothetical protein